MEMVAELLEVSGVERKLAVEIPAEVAAREWEKVANEFKRHARVPGFRPGKAPLGLVKRRFASDIKGEVIQQLVPEYYQEAVREKGISPLGRPSLENVTLEVGQPLKFEALFEVKPEVELPKYTGLEVSVKPPEVKDEEVEQRLGALREENAQFVAVEDRPIESGDLVTVDLEGVYTDRDENTNEPAIQEEDVSIEVGAENTLQVFSEALVGMNIGEEKTVEVEYPEDYPAKHLAGRKVRFTVEVTDIRRKELPELNDEFARDVGEFESLEEIRTRIREDLESAGKRNREAEIREALTKQLLAGVRFDVPQTLVRSHMADRLQALARNLAGRGVDPHQAGVNWNKIRDQLLPEVTDEVRTFLVLETIADREGIQVSDEALDQEIERMAESLERPVATVRSWFEDEERRESLRVEMRREQAMKLVIDSAAIN
jgi:trigger factor